MSDSKVCPFSIAPKSLSPQRNALRIEAMVGNDPRCTLMEKPEAKRLNPVRWVLSGGDARNVYLLCFGLGKCRLWVEAEGSIMNNRKAGCCPKCGTYNCTKTEFEGDEQYRVHFCRKCGGPFVLYIFKPGEELDRDV